MSFDSLSTVSMNVPIINTTHEKPLRCNQNAMNFNQIQNKNIHANNNSFSCNEEKQNQWNNGFGGHYDENDNYHDEYGQFIGNTNDKSNNYGGYNIAALNENTDNGEVEDAVMDDGNAVIPMNNAPEGYRGGFSAVCAGIAARGRGKGKGGGKEKSKAKDYDLFNGIFKIKSTTNTKKKKKGWLYRI